MCVAIDMILADERKQGLECGRSQEKEFLILKMLKNDLPIEQIAAITDKTIEEIQEISSKQ